MQYPVFNQYHELYKQLQQDDNPDIKHCNIAIFLLIWITMEKSEVTVTSEDMGHHDENKSSDLR